MTPSFWQDPELWHPDGDCLVFLHTRGSSRRGPSFQLPFEIIRASNSVPLLKSYSDWIQTFDTPCLDSCTCAVDGYIDCRAGSSHYELYIPAPNDCNRAQAFQYHLNTRNFFAWMFCKPVVGLNLGQALASLWETMERFRLPGVDNVRDLLDYLSVQRYSDFRECPDHALAALHLAEEVRIRDLYIDAFAHCVGMNERLVSSPSFEVRPCALFRNSYANSIQLLSRTSKALITKAGLEMDIRLDRVGRQLTSFLEYELSGAYLGLGDNARAHLDRFRSFINGFYVVKFGYWPPEPATSLKHSSFPKTTLLAMYTDFRNLYEYLVDTKSTGSMEQGKPIDGGLCVLQNVSAFDRRHGHIPLPHPLPLLPAVISEPRKGPTFDARKLSRSFAKMAKMEQKLAILAALSSATNTHNPSVMECPLVRAYTRFERESILKAEEKVSATDARKVRWIFVYAALQTLISVTKVPTEVKDTEGLSYNLCCATTNIPPWDTEAPAEPSNYNKFPSPDSTRPGTPKLDIRPDTNQLHASSTSTPRRTSPGPPVPPKDGASSRHRATPFCEILVPAYGNGLNAVQRDMDAAYSTPPRVNSPLPKNGSCEILIPNYGHGLNTVNQTEASPSCSSPINKSSNLPLLHTSSELAFLRWSDASMVSSVPSEASIASIAVTEEYDDDDEEGDGDSSAATATTGTTARTSMSLPTMDHVSFGEASTAVVYNLKGPDGGHGHGHEPHGEDGHQLQLLDETLVEPVQGKAELRQPMPNLDAGPEEDVYEEGDYGIILPSSTTTSRRSSMTFGRNDAAVSSESLYPGPLNIAPKIVIGE